VRADKFGVEVLEPKSARPYVLHIDGDIQKGFAAACDRAGLTDVSPHTLRHTAASWLLQARTDPWQGAGFPSMSVQTLLNCGHYHPDHMQEAADNIGRRPQNVRVMVRGL
jgi:integrase